MAAVNDIGVRLGAALRACRARQRLTQEELAERSGLSYKFIGEVERGKANPTVKTVARLADALEVGVATLFADPEPRRLPADYQISKGELQRVREALESIADIADNVTKISYSRNRRKRAARS